MKKAENVSKVLDVSTLYKYVGDDAMKKKRT